MSEISYACCLTGNRIEKIHVFRALDGENNDIVIFPAKRVAYRKYVREKMLSVKARPAESFHEANLSLIDRMHQIIHTRGKDGKMYPLKRMDKKCRDRLHEIVAIIASLFGHYFNYDIKEMFKALSELSDDQRRQKLSDVYSFILKEYDRKMKRNTITKNAA